MKKTTRFLCVLVLTLFCVLTMLTGCNQGYSVTFSDNYTGGSSVDVQTVDGKVTPPADPTRSGYDFCGWYYDSACSAELKVDFSVDVFSSNTTVYASWTVSQTTDGGDNGDNGDNGGSTVNPQAPWQISDTKHWKLDENGNKYDEAPHNTNGPAGSCADCGYGSSVAVGKKVYYYDHKGWGTVNCYIWTNGNDYGNWPGTAMEALEGNDGWFVLEIDSGAVNVIFNSGSSQTADLVIANGPYFAGENGCATMEEAQQAVANNQFTNQGGGGAVVGETANLMGIGGDWSTGIAMTKDGDNFVVLSQQIGDTDAFKVKIGDSWIGYEAVEQNGLSIRPDGDYSNIKVPAGTYNIYYNTTTGKITIEAVQ